MATPILVERAETVVLAPTCPLCHTVHTTLATESVDGEGYWTCVTCGQAWSARRLETAAEYARYIAAR
jgi:hypothetical protein